MKRILSTIIILFFISPLYNCAKNSDYAWIQQMKGTIVVNFDEPKEEKKEEGTENTNEANVQKNQSGHRFILTFDGSKPAINDVTWQGSGLLGHAIGNVKNWANVKLGGKHGDVTAHVGKSASKLWFSKSYFKIDENKATIKLLASSKSNEGSPYSDEAILFLILHRDGTTDASVYYIGNSMLMTDIHNENNLFDVNEWNAMPPLYVDEKSQRQRTGRMVLNSFFTPDTSNLTNL